MYEWAELWEMLVHIGSFCRLLRGMQVWLSLFNAWMHLLNAILYPSQIYFVFKLITSAPLAHLRARKCKPVNPAKILLLLIIMNPTRRCEVHLTASARGCCIWWKSSTVRPLIAQPWSHAYLKTVQVELFGRRIPYCKAHVILQSTDEARRCLLYRARVGRTLHRSRVESTRRCVSAPLMLALKFDLGSYRD